MGVNMNIEERNENIKKDFLKLYKVKTHKAVEQLSNKYNLSTSYIHRIVEDVTDDRMRKHKHHKTVVGNMIPFTEDFGIEEGKYYNIRKSYSGITTTWEHVKCLYKHKLNRYFTFEGVTVNRGNIICGEITVKGV
jgi:hypothetical protein